MNGVRELERFRVRSDDGKHDKTIVITQAVLDTATFAEPNAQALGLKSARTTDGFACNFVEDGVFEMVHPLGEIIVRRVKL